ncbi:MAG: hypothetical protein K0S02_2104 [Achromobacter mucicolens]|jgi:hypothetical protein|uniref:hypothetical protein n=1 Tax=Achromobacter mucicolens TaxID=1389922 RepID=UPI00242CAE7A|nr:hypothetical protein [Achromobacter mucicolens]MDF2861832.1 hypothetical protein [Achromobacter mucicolens]
MSSPEPVLSPTPVGNTLISLGLARAAQPAHVADGRLLCPTAANDEISPEAQSAGQAEAPARVPLSAWLSLAFYAIGTALLFSLGVAYRLFA